MTGVRVVAVGDPLGVDHGRLSITFPGAQPFEIDGNAYLKLQNIQSALLE